ncbi:MAG: hypothetical protein HY553_05870 [Elusimicrobia bacterium]|nr:hypothetical protein [Elusimicrobiota bacterium]
MLPEGCETPTRWGTVVAIRGRLATVEEVFFDDPADARGADIVRYVQRSSPLAGARCEEFHTLLLDLDRSIDEIWKGLHRWNRKKIRRAEREGLAYEAWYPAGDAVVREFLAFHERATRKEMLFPLHRGRLQRHAELGALDLSAIGEGVDRLSWHVHYRTAARARELYSVTAPREGTTTADRSLIGRAHRLQHWRDIQRLRAAGLRTYDFAGLYLGTSDRKLTGIDDFKRSFGGRIVSEFNCVEVRTVRGRLAIAIEALLRAVWSRQRRRQEVEHTSAGT